MVLGGATILSMGGRALGGEEGFHVALLSDTHVPGDKLNEYRGFRPWENLKLVVPQVAAVKPEWVLISGDVARLEGLPQDYAEVKGLLAPLASEVPVVMGLGNHDERSNFFAAFGDRAGVGQDVAGKHVTVIEHEVVRVVMLDSLLYVNKTAGLLGQAQWRGLVGWLRGVADRPVVIFVHHTLGDGDGELLDADRFFEVIRPHQQVKAVFYGHSHVWERREREGVQLINLPAVGYNFNDRQPVGWTEAWFGREGVRLKTHAFGGNREFDGQEIGVKWAKG
jgi:3',5'-cyclic AMP phosphodiesterase CpdA